MIPCRIVAENNKPEEQGPFTYGKTPAAIRLKEEIDKGAHYRPAVRILHVFDRRLGEVVRSRMTEKWAIATLLRADAQKAIKKSTADPIIKSLCLNLVAAKSRVAYRMIPIWDEGRKWVEDYQRSLESP